VVIPHVEQLAAMTGAFPHLRARFQRMEELVAELQHIGATAFIEHDIGGHRQSGDHVGAISGIS
jgi:hypothetical protein